MVRIGIGVFVFMSTWKRPAAKQAEHASGINVDEYK